MTAMRDLNDLYFFAQIVEHQGFAAAARVLGMPRSRLSRRLALLEERLGVRLVQRSTRRFAVTEIGHEYYRHCVAMLVEADAAQEAIDRTRAVPQGVVRVACPSAVLYFQVGAMIARFLAACPKVEVQLESTNRRVDVIREGFDIAIRVRFPPLDESELVMKVLAESAQRLVAAPRVLEGCTRPLAPADVGALPSLSWGGPHQSHEWRLKGPGDAEAAIRQQPRFVTEDMVALRHAAATHVTVRVESDGEGAGMRMTIEDNGKGFDPDSSFPGLGLRTMRERAAAAGGNLQIDSAPGAGTRVHCVLPHRDGK